MFSLSRCIARHYILSTTGRNKIVTAPCLTLFLPNMSQEAANSFLALSLRSGINSQSICCDNAIAEMNNGG